MSLVGPRPEVPFYVQHYTAEQRDILQCKPGITDLASLCFRDEEVLLGNADNLEEFYIQQCMPRKLALNREYALRANLLRDTWLILGDFLLSGSLLSGFRVLLRLWRERSAGEEDASVDPPARVGIIGAGSTGAKLALELIVKKKFGRVIVAFFDDDSQKWQKRIHEVPVVGMPECLLDGWSEKLDEVVIAMPSAPAERIRELDELLRQTGLRFYTVSCPIKFWGRQQTS